MQTFKANKGDVKPLSAHSPKKRQQIFFTGPGRTKQSFKAECDINTILARFKKTGIADFVNNNQPRFGDVTGLEYQNAMLLVANAKNLFNQLPSGIRDKFQNEPGLFFQFVQNPRNREEAEEMGLLRPEDPPGEGNPNSRPLTQRFREKRTGSSSEAPSATQGGIKPANQGNTAEGEEQSPT